MEEDRMAERYAKLLGEVVERLVDGVKEGVTVAELARG